MSERQFCKKQTPESPFCWARSTGKDSVGIDSTAVIRPGSYLGAPLMHSDDPYAE